MNLFLLNYLVILQVETFYSLFHPILNYSKSLNFTFLVLIIIVLIVTVTIGIWWFVSGTGEKRLNKIFEKYGK